MHEHSYTKRTKLNLLLIDQLPYTYGQHDTQLDLQFQGTPIYNLHVRSSNLWVACDTLM